MRRLLPSNHLLWLAGHVCVRGTLATHVPQVAACACAEIGDATVGSLASCTSKDSSLKAPGYFGALVATVTYVDHTGKVRTCRRQKIQGSLASVAVSCSTPFPTVSSAAAAVHLPCSSACYCPAGQRLPTGESKPNQAAAHARSW